MNVRDYYRSSKFLLREHSVIALSQNAQKLDAPYIFVCTCSDLVPSPPLEFSKPLSPSSSPLPPILTKTEGLSIQLLMLTKFKRIE